MEVWKDVKNYEGIYKISNTGKVKSLERIIVFGNKSALRPEKILKTRYGKVGYEYCILSDNKVKKTLKIHRLVALHFVPNPDNKKQVNHKDGNKANNNDWNLEWNTPKENIKHAYKIGLRKGIRGIKSHLSKLTEDNVLNIRKEYLTGNISQGKLGNKYGVSQGQIQRIVKNKNWVIN